MLVGQAGSGGVTRATLRAHVIHVAGLLCIQVCLRTGWVQTIWMATSSEKCQVRVVLFNISCLRVHVWCTARTYVCPTTLFLHRTPLPPDLHLFVAAAPDSGRRNSVHSPAGIHEAMQSASRRRQARMGGAGGGAGAGAVRKSRHRSMVDSMFNEYAALETVRSNFESTPRRPHSDLPRAEDTAL